MTKWYQPDPNVAVTLTSGLDSNGLISAFDLDGTLIRPTKNFFTGGPEDIVLLPERREILSKFIDNGFTLVIFTNQKLKNKKNKDKIEIEMRQKMDKLEYFMKIINLPMIVFISFGDGDYRKPGTGMWEILKRMLNSDINYERSFYVGDAAGRPEDFSDSDSGFAANNGLNFITQTDFFEQRKSTNELNCIANFVIENPKSIIVFMGMPGSGKSTFHSLLNDKVKDYIDNSLVRVSSDLLSSNKSKMKKQAIEEMKKGNAVIIDATNSKRDNRFIYYEIAEEYGYKIALVYFIRDGRGWNKLRPKRDKNVPKKEQLEGYNVPTIAYSMFFKYLDEPVADELDGPIFYVE